MEIGAGFGAAALRGEDNSDEMRMKDGKVAFLSNNAGGVLGGISTGQDIVLRFAVKPTSSIPQPRKTVTRRGRNASVRFLTGHDMKGFADHDWAQLARKNEVAAIYMGKKSARFVQGRLLMHGADRATPVTVIENASRADQRILETTLDHMADDISSAAM